MAKTQSQEKTNFKKQVWFNRFFTFMGFLAILYIYVGFLKDFGYSDIKIIKTFAIIFFISGFGTAIYISTQRKELKEMFK